MSTFKKYIGSIQREERDADENGFRNKGEVKFVFASTSYEMAEAFVESLAHGMPESGFTVLGDEVKYNFYCSFEEKK